MRAWAEQRDLRAVIFIREQVFTERAECRRRLRIDRERSAPFDFGVHGAIRLIERRAQQEMRLEHLRIEPHRLLQCMYGVRCVSGGKQTVSQQICEARGVWIQLECFLEIFRGAGELAMIVKPNSACDVSFRAGMGLQLRIESRGRAARGCKAGCRGEPSQRQHERGGPSDPSRTMYTRAR